MALLSVSRLRTRLAAALLLVPIAAAADEWDVADPPGPRETLEFEARSGTWMSVDVHPDGRTLLFDLLGDLYTVPIEGGAATRIAGGIPWEWQPRFSPDGERILFTSDRGGGDNLWMANADGTDARAVTEESYRLVNNGAWHPSGEWAVVKKHFTSTRSMGAGEIWMYRIPQGGGGVQLTQRKNDQLDVGEPTFGPDGRFLYWSEDMSTGRSFRYNKDPNRTIYMIRRLDLETGEITNLIDVAGGAVRPQVSPDGGTVAFVRRIDMQSTLCLYDLSTGEIRALWSGLDEDQQETWSLFGVHPGFDWTPDGRSIVISGQGGLWRVDVRTGEARSIPFRVDVEISVADPVRFSPPLADETFPVRVIRWPAPAPDGSVVFQALGTLWRQPEPDATPRALFPAAAAFRFAPSISPDGRRVAYTTWSDGAGGTVRTSSLDGRGERTVVRRPGHYAWVAWSPDGNWLVVHRAGGDRYRGHLWAEDEGIWLVRADGKEEPRFVTREGSKPRFDRTGQRIYLISREGEESALISVNRLGSDRRVHATSEHAWDFVLSPDERHLAFEELWNTYVTPFVVHASPVSVGPKMKNLPVRRLSRDGGTYLGWSRDGATLHWSHGPTLYSVAVDSLFVEEAPEEEADEAEAEDEGADEADDADAAPADDLPEAATRALGWDEPTDVPDTDLWIVGAAILPMDDLSRIEDGVVHVRGARIEAVGTRDELAPPEGAVVIDGTGKTLLPGFVDIHAHTGSSNQGIYAQQNWAFLANLAFGVTTTHDPSNNSQMIFAQSELVRNGTLLGPRVLSTGTILYGAEGSFKTVIDDYEDARSAVAERADWGAYTVKSYNQPRRDQRQMVIEAGRELGIMVVPEGGSTLQYNLTQLVDGHTTIEHALPVSPIYDPELRLLSRGTGYTPTLGVGYGGLWGENYWYQHTNVWENERLLRFVPEHVVKPRSIRRTMAPDGEYHHFGLAEMAAEVVRRGGNLQVGSHGQMQGISVHWEFWMFEQGGLTPHEALRAATWMGARVLGLDGILGSVREGLLADLILVEGDPTEDVRRSENVSHVMIHGRLYDARTLEQLAPDRRTLPEGPPKQGGSGGAAHSHNCAEHSLEG